jgi:hypothetical protein
MAITFRGHTFQPLNLVMAVTTIAWLSAQEWLPKPLDPTWNQAFLLVLGAWIAQKSFVQQRRDDNVRAKVEAVADTVQANTSKIAELQENSQASKDRADASEAREGYRPDPNPKGGNDVS